MNEQRVIEALETASWAWRDYILVGDPPAISRWTSVGNLYGVVVGDEELYEDCIKFLRQHGARSFASADEAKRAFQREQEGTA